MKNISIQSIGWIFILLLSLTACDAISTGGNVGMGIVIAVVVVIALGGIAFKFLGGMLKIGIWGIAILVLLVIGFIGWIIAKSMGWM